MRKGLERNFFISVAELLIILPRTGLCPSTFAEGLSFIAGHNPTRVSTLAIASRGSYGAL